MTTYQRREQLPICWPALIETALLGLTGVMLLAKASHGGLAYYINPRYTLLVQGAALLLIAMGLGRVRGIFSESPELLAGRAPAYMLLAIPLLLGTFTPAQPLGAASLAGRADALGGFQQGRLAQGDTRMWDLLDWGIAASTQQLPEAGAPAYVEGFVFRPRGSQVVYVARYVVACCAADASAVGMPLVGAGVDALADDQWVAVDGVLSSTLVDGEVRPAIAARAIRPIALPGDPYLSPR
ncbi:TIGR03943 family protein [Chloroflexia bacterium SDU3-3]|nr:TIGR03943 family protein [Chloroflexia bacterium SDU3-3]